MTQKQISEAAKKFYKHYILVCIYRRRLAEVPIALATNMSESTLRMLDVLREQKECSLKRLCRIIGLSIPAGSIMVDKAVNAGLVCRKTSDKDRRKVILSLTDKGLKAITEIQDTCYKLFGEAFEKIPSKDVIELSKSIDKIDSILSKIDLLPEEK